MHVYAYPYNLYILIQFVCTLYNTSMHILYNVYASLYIIYKFTMYYIYMYILSFFLPFICQNCIWDRSGFFKLCDWVWYFTIPLMTYWQFPGLIPVLKLTLPCQKRDSYHQWSQLVLAPMLMTPFWQLFESYWFVMVNHCPQIHSHRCLSNCFTMGSLCKVFTPNTLQKHIN